MGRPYVVDTWQIEDEDDAYEIHVEADELLIQLGHEVREGTITPDQVRDQWEPFRELWSDLYEPYDGPEDDPVWSIPDSDDPDAWPGRWDFCQDAEQLGIPGVGYTVVGTPSPMTGLQFRIFGKDTLERVRELLSDKYTVLSDPAQLGAEQEAEADAAWLAAKGARANDVWRSIEVFRNGAAEPRSVSQAAEELVDMVYWLIDEHELPTKCQTIGGDTVEGRGVLEIGMNAARQLGVGVVRGGAPVGAMAYYNRSENLIRLSGDDFDTPYGLVGRDDVAVSLIHELARSSQREREELFLPHFSSLGSYYESCYEAAANVVAKTAGLSTDGFSPRYIWSYVVGTGRNVLPPGPDIHRYWQLLVERLANEILEACSEDKKRSGTSDDQADSNDLPV